MSVSSPSTIRKVSTSSAPEGFFVSCLVAEIEKLVADVGYESDEPQSVRTNDDSPCLESVCCDDLVEHLAVACSMIVMTSYS